MRPAAVGGLLIEDWRHALGRGSVSGCWRPGPARGLCFARSTPAIVTDSDFAVTEVQTALATRGRLLVGPYSRFGWNHPDRCISTFRRRSMPPAGTRRDLYAVAVAINVIAVATLVWIVARTNRGPLLVCVRLRA